MGTNYEHLTAEERATLMVMRADGCSQRPVARCLGRSPSTISRELARNTSCCKPVGDRIAILPTMHHWPARALPIKIVHVAQGGPRPPSTIRQPCHTTFRAWTRRRPSR
jgi:hypothetical protein